MKTKAELDAEIAAFLATSPPGDAAEIARSIAGYRQANAGRSRRAKPNQDITGEQALTMPRFEFVAHCRSGSGYAGSGRGGASCRATRR